MTTTPPSPTTPSTPTASVKDLAGATKADRNRAIDLYRAVAMIAVSVGHWAAIVMTTDADGELVTGNALEFAPSMSWLTWILQVMPLFFVVGGFSSAMSLDSHNARGGRPQDWVAARLRRMLAPTITLAGVWLVGLAVATAAGAGAYAAAGATAAAIPLWFLANYTIDTAIAPYVLPAFRKRPVLVAGGTVTAFGFIELARFADVPYLPHVNWVIGWLLFQMAGFAWRDGLLPTGRAMAVTAAGLWAAAIAAVTLGPWPTAMVHFPGLENSPTHPPTVALLLFGAAYSATAVAVAPRVSDWLARHGGAWSAVVAANGVALSVYLWHFTAAVIAGATFFAAGWLPTADVGTAAWWIQKLPLMGASAVVLAVIVAMVSGTERRALLAPRAAFDGGQALMLATAAGTSAAVKAWANGSVAAAAVGMTVVLVIWFGVLKPSATEPAAV
ncbi:MAG: acyltransferase [Actinomycetota bacterium]